MRIAEDVTEAFLLRHPDWLERYGDRARAAGIEDARFHVQFLSAAVEQNSPAAFRDYVRWTAGVLESRGISRDSLQENLIQVREAGAALLAPAQLADLDRIFSLPDGRTAAASQVTDDDRPLALPRRMFVQAILRGERQAALNIAREALREGHDLEALYLHVFQEGLYEVGRRWETNAITVAQEHMATAVTQYVMAQMFEHITPPPESCGSAVITGVPGELHHIGAMMVADMLEVHGWRVQFLGSNLPVPAVLATIRESSPDVVGISVTMLFNLQYAARLIDELKAAGGSCRIVVGGAAFRVGGDWRGIGADAYAADIAGALDLLAPRSRS